MSEFCQSGYHVPGPPRPDEVVGVNGVGPIGVCPVGAGPVGAGGVGAGPPGLIHGQVTL